MKRDERMGEREVPYVLEEVPLLYNQLSTQTIACTLHKLHGSTYGSACRNPFHKHTRREKGERDSLRYIQGDCMALQMRKKDN